MTALERAETYAAIFVNVGDRWRRYTPVDATVEPDNDVMHLQGIRMRRVQAGWLLSENGKSWLVQSAEPREVTT